ncbi:NADP(H)-dependent aldo-keto reductase [Flavobacteriaceae bacterium]|nr:NADP(H)-dependent aldo-keto reductase [Flavobacteriaceae bacterium]
MKYNTLGSTDLKISEICLGTMTWGRQNTQEEGWAQMDYALEQGIQFWDTAELYPVPTLPELYAHTEIIMGQWFKQSGKRSEIVLASKIAGPAGFTAHIRTNGFQSTALKEAVEGSLKRLQTDYIDLYQLHWPERNTNFFGKLGYTHDSDEQWVENFEEVLDTLGALVAEGKIRHIGLSNETPWGLMRYLDAYRAKQERPRIQTVQNPYSLLNRSYEVGLAECSMREQVGLLAYSPLGFGVLSGKYLGGVQPEGARVTLFPNYNRYSNPQAVQATEAYAQLAQEHGLSLAQMSLAFVRTRPFVQSTIIGATSMEQLRENAESAQVALSEDVLRGIEAIHVQYPNPSP